MAYYSLGFCYLRISEPEKAYQTFDSAIELDRSFSRAYLGKALSLFALNKFNDAVDTFTLSQKINKTDYLNHLVLGINYFVNNEYHNSINEFSIFSKKMASLLAYEPRKLGSLYAQFLCSIKINDKNKIIHIANELLKSESNRILANKIYTDVKNGMVLDTYFFNNRTDILVPIFIDNEIDF